jgi:methyl-accepting chemotaxis protein
MNQVWIQIIVTLGTVFLGVVGAGKYALKELTQARNQEREEIFKLFKDMQEQMIEAFFKLQNDHLETYNRKNGSIERITHESNNAIREFTKGLTKAMDKLSASVDENTRFTREGTLLTRQAVEVAKEIK